MPWQEVSVMDRRREFVRLALQEGVNRRELCRRFGISPDVGYKWLARWKGGDRGLADRSRRPRTSPKLTTAAIEAVILTIRDRHPAWGARKIAHCLERDGFTVPALSTVHQILSRNGRVLPRDQASFEPEAHAREPPGTTVREPASKKIAGRFDVPERDALHGPHRGK